MSRKLLLVGLIAAIGALSVVLGVTAIYAPAGLIVAGVILLAVAFLPDWGA
jgi:hypothetical protein